ncbi:MAG: hypothetical protein PF569_08950 [Candidatus Woesearchaeota archaeon]|jgi:hypothetical protein|nr:hypothetical protein [Candidatus Woesearchaeota archaeon]
MKIRKNKKGIGFFALIGIVTLFLMGILFFTIVNPYEKIDDVIDFGKTITTIDTTNSKIAAEEFFKKQEIDNIFSSGKKQYISSLGLSTNELLNRKYENNDDELVTCTYAGIELWYNQRNLDTNNQDITKIEEDVDEETEEGEEEEEDSQENNNVEHESCLPNFNENLEESLSYYFEQKLKNELEKSLRVQEINDEPVINLEYNEETNTINSKITTYYKETSKNSEIILEIEYEKEYILGEFPTLLKTITNKVIPQISDELKNKVPGCLKENDFDEDFCIDKTFQDLIKKEDDKLLNTYEFKIERIKEISSEEYIGLKITIINKILNEEEFIFGIILKDTIPYTLIKFELENFQGADNVANIKIEKPKFDDQISYYVVLFSYENFFDNLNNPEDYNILLKLLQENKVPKNFESTGIFDLQENEYHFSTINDKIDLNLLLVKNEISEEDLSDNKEKLIAKIYQIYNHQEKQYELLKPNKPLYVFVFATDNNYNYYVEEIQGKAKQITTQTQYGPSALISENVPKASGTIAGEQSSLFFQISGYENSNFANYDIYIVEKDQKLANKCEADDAIGCYYLDGAQKLTIQNPEKLTLITSESQITNPELYNIIYGSDFTPNLVLENKKEYKLNIIPVDSQGVGIIKNTPIDYELKKSTNEEFTFYQLINLEGQYKTPYSQTITIVDNKAPSANSFIFTNTNKYEISGNTVKLKWQSLPNENVVKLDTKITIKDENMQIIEQYNKLIGTDQIITTIPNGAKQIEVTQIVPIDSSENKNSEIANQNINVIIPLP